MLMAAQKSWIEIVPAASEMPPLPAVPCFLIPKYKQAALRHKKVDDHVGHCTRLVMGAIGGV